MDQPLIRTGGVAVDLQGLPSLDPGFAVVTLQRQVRAAGKGAEVAVPGKNPLSRLGAEGWIPLFRGHGGLDGGGVLRRLDRNGRA